VAEGASAAPSWLRRLARLRVALGFVAGVAAFALAAPTALTLAAGLPIALLGEAVRVWAAGHLNKGREVTRSGPYRWSAHPLYVGSSLMGVGLAIGAGSVAVAVLVAVYLTVTLTAAIRSEEAFLRGRFGAEYDRYRARGEVDRARRFSWRRAIDNREHRALLGLAAAVLLLVAKATYNGSF
jgi:protein-S-isoprenylcysteine O-methyltransferase Ste14